MTQLSASLPPAPFVATTPLLTVLIWIVSAAFAVPLLVSLSIAIAWLGRTIVPRGRELKLRAFPGVLGLRRLLLLGPGLLVFGCATPNFAHSSPTTVVMQQRSLA